MYITSTQTRLYKWHIYIYNIDIGHWPKGDKLKENETRNESKPLIKENQFLLAVGHYAREQRLLRKRTPYVLG